MSELGSYDQRRVEQLYGGSEPQNGHLALALGIIAMLIGMTAMGAGAWLAYGNASSLFQLPGGLPAAESHTVSMYLVACGAMTFVLGAFSIYKSHDM